MSASSHQSWLRRVSDYHSGGVSATEQQAVEQHLQTCAECQSALAAYRRFYTLAATPIQLDSPALALQEKEAPMISSPQTDDQIIAVAPRPLARRRVIPVVAATLVVVLLSIAFFVLVRSRSGSDSGCNPKATIPQQGRIMALSMDSATDGWAASFGQVGTTSGSYLLHYHNCRWSKFGNEFTDVVLKSISMDSATDGWAVGYDTLSASDGSGGFSITRQVTLHYTDGIWRNTPMPAVVGTRGGVFPEVDMLSSQSGWMLALSTDPSLYPMYVLLRYQQGAWVNIALPSLTIDAYEPLVAISSDECFLLGGHVAGDVVHTNVITHYLKGTWTTWTGSDDVTLLRITATPTGQMWASGTREIDSQHIQPYLQRFDGQTWRAVPVSLVPDIAVGNTFDANGLAMTSATEGWMVMFTDKQNYILHLQHGQWRPELRVPRATFLDNLQMVSPTDGWVVAHDSENAPNFSTLYHYNGRQWSVVGS